MSMTQVESWAGADLSQIGPIYPMVGSEGILFLLGLAFWIGFHVLQFRVESKEMAEDDTAARTPERLQRVFTDEAKE